MARRRKDDVYRENVSVFSLSFLDVFACALGALVLILLIIFNQVTMTFDSSTLKAKIEAIESKTEAVVGDVRANAAAEQAAREWDEKPAVEARREQLEDQLEQMRASGAQFQGVTTQTIEEARKVVEQVQSQTVRQRESANNMWFGTASVQQKVRLMEVFDDRVLDHSQSPPRVFRAGSSAELIDALKRVSGLEYPLFVVRPEGIDLWRTLERDVEQSGLLYGFEPYTSGWSSILSSKGGDQ